MDIFYWLAVGMLDAIYWGGLLEGYENLPARGPAVFIANHLGPRGPIGAVCSIPRRLYPWIVSDMVEAAQAAAYLRKDFVEPRLGLKPPTSITFSQALAKITVPLLRSLGCVPVYKGYEQMRQTWALSLGLLLRGKYLLIFPEDATLPPDPLTGFNSFQRAFARLGEIYYERTRQCLPFYPVAVHGSHRVRVGEPIRYSPLNPPGVERSRLRNLIEAAIRRMYLDMEGEGALGLIAARK